MEDERYQKEKKDRARTIHAQRPNHLEVGGRGKAGTIK